MLLMEESVKQREGITPPTNQNVYSCKMHLRAEILLLSVVDGGTEPFTGRLLQAGVDVELEATAVPWLTWRGCFECRRAKGGNPNSRSWIVASPAGLSKSLPPPRECNKWQKPFTGHRSNGNTSWERKSHAASPNGMGAALQHGRALPSDRTTQADPSAR